VPELRPVEREHVLQHQLRLVVRFAVLMPLDVESDDTITLCQKSFRPTA
jgi:hypothetical protein